ncbi:hypothetical protein AHAS_Ahas12G0037500 [Arachis hypogaea]
MSLLISTIYFATIIDIDKSWISKSQNSVEYRQGLNNFLDFAFTNASSDGMMKCPCPNCEFQLMQTREDAYDYLLTRPFFLDILFGCVIVRHVITIVC